MRFSINEVQLMGRLGRDLELRTLQSGVTTVSFSIATDYTYKDKQGEFQKETEWHNCVAWGKTAELMAGRLSKGSRVLIQGRLTHRKHWEHDTVTISEVRVTDFSPFDDQLTAIPSGRPIDQITAADEVVGQLNQPVTKEPLDFV